MMSTYLQSVSPDELAGLKADPAKINQLDKPLCFITQFGCTINYVLSGPGYPACTEPLGAVIHGAEFVETSTLENGSFGVIDKADCVVILPLLDVDLEKVKAILATIDHVVMDEEELYEAEDLTPKELAEYVLDGLSELKSFYSQVVKLGNAVLTYTT